MRGIQIRHVRREDMRKKICEISSNHQNHTEIIRITARKDMEKLKQGGKKYV